MAATLTSTLNLLYTLWPNIPNVSPDDTLINIEKIHVAARTIHNSTLELPEETSQDFATNLNQLKKTCKIIIIANLENSPITLVAKKILINNIKITTENNKTRILSNINEFKNFLENLTLLAKFFETQKAIHDLEMEVHDLEMENEESRCHIL
jgi:hypothetical protein